MSEGLRISKVEILIQQKRYVEAEKILRDLLAEEPDTVYYLALFADLNLKQNKFDTAMSTIENAIGLHPDSAHLFYIKSRIRIQQGNLYAAEKDIIEAIDLEPLNAEYTALLANIKIGLKNFDMALEIANRALDLDAANLLALNTRSIALVKLNRGDESLQTIEEALRQNPNNAYTHANYGWGLLEKGSHEKALEHFKESLIIYPDFNYAHAGMLEALKATNPIYRLFLKYSFRMGNLRDRYKFPLIICSCFACKLLFDISEKNEKLLPYLLPVAILVLLVMLSRWIITPLSNVYLRFNKYGKFLLNEKEKLSSSLVGSSLIALVFLILLLAILPNEITLQLSMFFFAIILPIGTVFSPSNSRNSLVIYSLVLSVVGLFAIAAAFAANQTFNLFTFVFFSGFVTFQWTANFWLIKASE